MSFKHVSTRLCTPVPLSEFLDLLCSQDLEHERETSQRSTRMAFDAWLWLGLSVFSLWVCRFCHCSLIAEQAASRATGQGIPGGQSDRAWYRGRPLPLSPPTPRPHPPSLLLALLLCRCLSSVCRYRCTLSALDFVLFVFCFLSTSLALSLSLCVSLSLSLSLRLSLRLSLSLSLSFTHTQFSPPALLNGLLDHATQRPSVQPRGSRLAAKLRFSTLFRNMRIVTLPS